MVMTAPASVITITPMGDITYIISLKMTLADPVQKAAVPVVEKAPIIPTITATVSYTHLDVYKRQTFAGRCIF